MIPKVLAINSLLNFGSFQLSAFEVNIFLYHQSNRLKMVKLNCQFE